MAQEESLDALIVGAGFHGVYLLHKLKNELNLKVKAFERGGDIGGTWYWNSYPGARVDSEGHFYQYSDPSVYNDFNFTEKYPPRDELMAYFHHVQNKWDLKEWIQLNSSVTKAEFNDNTNQWKVTIEGPDGSTSDVITKFLILCIGFSGRHYIPSIKGLETFKGEMYHTCRWPKDKKIQFEGKRVAVIGTGASGVQVIQEVGPVAKQVTVYQRTPNIALPMQQCSLPNQSVPSKNEFPQVFQDRLKTFAGMLYNIKDMNTLEDDPETRRALYEKFFEDGGFHFWLGTYKDLFTDAEGNKIAYEFWAEKTRARVTDPKKRDAVAPLKAPHPFGVKRPSLEQNFYEILNLPSVAIIDIGQSPILEFTSEGIKTEHEGVQNYDIIVLATGYDAFTGGMLDIAIKNGNGQSIKDKWKDVTTSFLGLSLSGFPNMFYTYGPLSPAAFCNGPTSAEVQGDWVTGVIQHMVDHKKKRVEATVPAEENWTKIVGGFWMDSLFPQAKSWYQGSNIPGKRIEPLCFSGGLPTYMASLEDCKAKGYEGFVLS